MKLGLTAMALAALVILGPNLTQAVFAQQQSSIPDAPTPQAPPPLTGPGGAPITPGIGAGSEPTGGSSSSATSSATPDQPDPNAPSSRPPTREGKDEVQTAPPELPAANEGMEALTHLVVNVNFVEVPVTVKDPKGHLVAGLTYRDFKVYENNSLGAIKGALTPYDEIAVYSYGNGAQDRSHGFTGGQSARVPFLLEMVKSSGTEMIVPVNSGPLAGCPIHVNGNCADPTIQPGFSTGAGGGVMTIPKEIHTLNDAILAAATELSKRPKGRRRIIYVISDGKEYGSKATFKEVVHYLEANKIAVYGTAVGTSAMWGEGTISRLHLPFTMYDNILSKYTLATGGTLDSELSTNGIEKSYQRIAEEARNQYTLGYVTHEPFIDGKFRKIDVRVTRPGLEIIAKTGYYPSAQDARPLGDAR